MANKCSALLVLWLSHGAVRIPLSILTIHHAFLAPKTKASDFSKATPGFVVLALPVACFRRRYRGSEILLGASEFYDSFTVGRNTRLLQRNCFTRACDVAFRLAAYRLLLFGGALDKLNRSYVPPPPPRLNPTSTLPSRSSSSLTLQMKYHCAIIDSLQVYSRNVRLRRKKQRYTLSLPHTP